MSPSPRPLRRAPWLVVLGALLALLLATPAHAQAPLGAAPQLGIRPVGEADGAFLSLELQPGEERIVEVEVTNQGSSPLRARTFAADAYTIVNGGFGLRDAGAPTTRSTAWLMFPTEELALEPGQAVVRSVRIRVPADAPAGQHLTGLAVENADPIKGTGQVALNQVVRKAIAVLITVPGATEARLAVDAGDHLRVADRSVVGVSLRNTGNVLLRPSGRVTVSDARGVEVAAESFSMDSFYAGDAARLELPLDEQLPPGDYTIGVAIADPERGIASSVQSRTMAVVPEVQPVAATTPIETPLPRAMDELLERSRHGGTDAAPLAAIITGFLTLVVLALLAVRRRRRPSGDHAAG